MQALNGIICVPNIRSLWQLEMIAPSRYLPLLQMTSVLHSTFVISGTLQVPLLARYQQLFIVLSVKQFLAIWLSAYRHCLESRAFPTIGLYSSIIGRDCPSQSDVVTPRPEMSEDEPPVSHLTRYKPTAVAIRPDWITRSLPESRVIQSIIFRLLLDLVWSCSQLLLLLTLFWKQ